MAMSRRVIKSSYYLNCLETQPAKLPAGFGVHFRFPVAITEAIVINKQGLGGGRKQYVGGFIGRKKEKCFNLIISTFYK